MPDDRSFSRQITDGANALVDRLIIFGKGTTPALVIAAAMFAYLNQPLIRFIDAWRAYEGAFVAGISLVLLVGAMTVRKDFLGIIAGLGGVILGTLWIGDALDVAARRAAANDRRCYKIEVEMLSAASSRRDLPELFQALGCRPLSTLEVAPAPKPR